MSFLSAVGASATQVEIPALARARFVNTLTSKPCYPNGPVNRNARRGGINDVEVIEGTERAAINDLRSAAAKTYFIGIADKITMIDKITFNMQLIG